MAMDELQTDNILVLAISTSFNRICEIPKNSVSWIGNLSWGQPEGSFFNSCYTEAATPFPELLHLIRTLYFWVLSAEVSGTIFKVFGMMWPWIEPRSPGPLANTLPTRPIS